MKAGANFLEARGPRVFTMPSGADFLPALVDGVLAACGEASPYALSDAMILAPTRRAARALAEAFVQARGGKGATLLPDIRAIGDVGADAPPFAPGAIALQAPPPLPAEKMLFDLTELVQARLRASGQSNALPVALAEAEALAQLINEAETEGIDSFDVAAEDFQERLASQPEHVQRAARFLDIVMRHWPRHLREQGVSGPAAWRAFVSTALARSWQQHPPEHMVIAAGSTGSVPATAQLLDVVARLPHGAIVLPGLDESLSDADWKEVMQSPGHPQYGLSRLLARMKIGRAGVKRWPGAPEGLQARRRRRMINEALLPAPATADWRERLEALARAERLKPVNLVRKALQGLSLVEADNEEEEALVLALAIRETLEDPQKTAILVTPDRALAQRVRAALWRWHIDIDDSAGTPLDRTAPGIFLTLIGQLAVYPDDPVILAALLGTKLATLGMAPAQAHACAQMLEARILRGVARHRVDDLRHVIAAHGKDDDGLDPVWRSRLCGFAQRLHEALAPLLALQQASAATFAKAQAQAAEALAASDEQEGAARLWSGRDGAAAAALLRALILDAERLGTLDAAAYAHVFGTLAHQRPVRPPAPRQPRARILGPLEARMLSADLVALGGLNESVWPAGPAQDPFLPASLRTRLGLPDPERKLGLAAHDFAEHASKARVLLTRSRRKGADPAVASRWLWRLRTLVRSAVDTDRDVEKLLAPATPYLALARRLDHGPAKARPVEKPEPRPPVSKRPRSLYVTRIKTLVRNPYAIYARFILGLKPLDPLGARPGAAQWGSAMHDALERFLEAGGAIDAQAESRLVALFEAALRENGFGEDQMVRQSARGRRAIKWFLDWERQRREDGWRPVLLEGAGELAVTVPGGKDFILKARADRIDRGPDGFAVLDYKTGSMPSPREVWAVFDPQLPLEAAILQQSGFARDGVCVRGEAVSLAYVKLSGGSEAGGYQALEQAGTRSIKEPHTAADFQRRSMLELQRLIAWFDNPQTPYLCQPRAKYTDSYSDYDLLARRPEWAVTPEDGSGDGA